MYKSPGEVIENAVKRHLQWASNEKAILLKEEDIKIILQLNDGVLGFRAAANQASPPSNAAEELGEALIDNLRKNVSSDTWREGRPPVEFNRYEILFDTTSDLVRALNSELEKSGNVIDISTFRSR